MSNLSKMEFTIETGSRLHFGLTRFRSDPNAKYNGLGAMVSQPGVKLEISGSTGFSTSGSERIEPFANAWCHHLERELPSCHFTLSACPPSHSGLGSGTQLAHATAHALNCCFGIGSPQTEEVAAVLARGKRSMIGSFGFEKGGLVVDAPDPINTGQLAWQGAIPIDWRTVLVLHKSANKKFGVQEQAAFDSINIEQNDRSLQLEDLIENRIIPSVVARDFSRFSHALHEYGKLSGEYYTDVQGGIYNGPVINMVVEFLHSLNAGGIGQSSWGPVVFSWCENQADATVLLEQIRNRLGNEVTAWIAKPMNSAAIVSPCLPSRQ